MGTVKRHGPKISQIWAFILTLAGHLGPATLESLVSSDQHHGVICLLNKQQHLKHLGQSQAIADIE